MLKLGNYSQQCKKNNVNTGELQSAMLTAMSKLGNYMSAIYKYNVKNEHLQSAM